jgi:uncharacterized cupredoxin-like copper-binding protein
MEHLRHTVLFLAAAASSLVPMRGDANETIRVTLLSNAIQLETHTVKPGALTFDVTNAADNHMGHEMVVLKTDLADDHLPLKNGQVPESRFKKMGEVEDVAPGKSKQLTLRLAPGHYVLICNKVGHYSQGMHASLNVAR